MYNFQIMIINPKQKQPGYKKGHGLAELNQSLTAMTDIR